MGAGGSGRETLDIIEACIDAGQNYEMLGYIVDSEYGVRGQSMNGKPILGDFNWFKDNTSEFKVICSLGDSLLQSPSDLPTLEKSGFQNLPLWRFF